MARPLFLSKERLLLCLVFISVTLLFVCYRHGHPYIWDDSVNLAEGVAKSRCVEEYHQAANEPDMLVWAGHVWHDVFGHIAGGGYRPLAELFSVLIHCFFLDSQSPTVLHLLIVGSIYGGLAVSLFCLARRFVGHAATAAFATFLVMASPPLVATSWVVMTGVQAVVPLATCVALLCYFKSKEPGRHYAARGLLLTIMIFGPWFREFLGIVSILVMFLEWQRCRRPTPLTAIAALCLLHAIFPSAILHWLFFPQLPLRSVFAMGSLAGSLNSPGIRWYALWHFLPLLPPSLLVLAAVSGVVASLKQLAKANFYPLPPYSGGEGRGEGGQHPGQTLMLLHITSTPSPQPLPPEYRGEGNPLLSAWACLVWLAVTLVPVVTGWFAPLHGICVCLGFAVIGSRKGLFLPFWFLAALLPFLRVFTEHIHYLYALPPAAIIVAKEIEALVFVLSNTNPKRKRGTSLAYASGWCRAGVIGIVALAILDQAMNLVGAYQVNRVSYGGMPVVARWFEEHVPKGTVVVSNVLHAEEIKRYSGGHFENYWTVALGVSDPSRVVEEPAQLAKLLANRGDRPVYFLNDSFDYWPRQAGYHRHKFAGKPFVPQEFLGPIHQSKTRYFFLDPLRHFVPREYVPFLGAPDLVNDFYCGLPHHRWFFRYEVYADYRVYRVMTEEIESMGTQRRDNLSRGPLP